VQSRGVVFSIGVRRGKRGEIRAKQFTFLEGREKKKGEEGMYMSPQYCFCR